MSDLSLHQLIEQAEKGDGEAQFLLGGLYYSGSGVRQDFLVAAGWFEKASHQGNSQAAFNLGCMYANGQGITTDLAKAMKWYTQAAENGHANAQNNLANLYERDEQFVDAAKWYRRAADQGLPNAQASLAFALSNGRGVPVDEVEAVKYYRLAAEQGFSPAQSNLGVMYAEGRGTATDPIMAVQWIRSAAEQGYGPAQNILGDFYSRGFGVPVDSTAAVNWYSIGAKQGRPDSQNSLAILYATGEGVAEDRVRAFMWFAAAASNGSSDAAENMYRVPIDNSSDIYKLISAAATGNLEAQRDLAVALHEGKGVQQDADASHYWLRRAATSGDPWSQTTYALELKPSGDPEVEREKIHWLSLAAEQGDDRARFNLGLKQVLGEGTNSDVESGVKHLLLASLGGFVEARSAIDAIKPTIEEELWPSIVEKVNWPDLTFILGPLVEGHLDPIRFSQENDDGSDNQEWLIFEREAANAMFLGATSEHALLDTVFGEKVTVKQIYVGRAYVDGKTNTAITINLSQIHMTNGTPVYWKPSENALNAVANLIGLLGARTWVRWSYTTF